ncbi:MAG TPA: type II toxin-antitoxin system VapC family toxin [Terriglobales bacterium]|nr:type II toxin-antitoxin system VapC family toxin [Terriglobales bacterium]
MSGFLLDTNVISEITRPKPDASVVEWIERTDESLLYLSVLTIGELRRGIFLLADGRRRASLEAWFDNDLMLRFSGRILPIDLTVADRWGRISAIAAANGTPIPVIYGLLAGTAVQYNLTIVSRDEAFGLIAGIEFFNPWRT